MPRKLLIIAYTFPPSPGIGGRRWAKFSKYLHRNGYDIKVISSKWRGDDQSNWIRDIQEFEPRIKRIPSGYPKALTQFSGGTIHALLYKLSLWYVKLTVPGSYYDRSAKWKSKLLPLVEKHIKHGYETIIITCAPYRAAWFLTDLKIKYPNIKLIVDFRDPWDMRTTLYGFSDLSEKRKKFEWDIQDTVIRLFDRVISVYAEQTKSYQEQYPEMTYKFHTIDNGFDKDDFADVSIRNGIPETGKIQFLFAGSFYPGAQHILEDFIDSLTRLKESHPEVYHQLSFTFFGGVPDFFHTTIAPHKEILQHGGTISLNEVYQKIAESNFMTLFLLDEMNYSLSTKFYEYISQNKPVVVFARGGSAGEFVRDNNLGYFADFGHMDHTLIELVKEYNSGLRFNPKNQVDTSLFDVENLTQRVIKVIEN